MYNGIGLTTPRGSGTNGYVQTNKAHVRNKKDRVIEYQSEEEIQKAERLMFREPNKDILEHERKRRIEAKCFEMRDLMEEQGYKDSEIEDQVTGYREALMAEEFGKGDSVSKVDIGKPLSNSTHAVAAAAQQKNDQLKSALKISSDFKDGSSLQKKVDIRKEAEKEKSKWIDSGESSSSAASSSSSDSSDSDSDHKDADSADLSPKPRKKHHSSKSKSKKSKKASKRKKSLKKKVKKKSKETAQGKKNASDDFKGVIVTSNVSSEEDSPERVRQLHSTISDKRNETSRDQRSKYSYRATSREASEFHESVDSHHRRRLSSREDSREESYDRHKNDNRSKNHDDYGSSDFRRVKHSDRYDDNRKLSSHEIRRPEDEMHHHGHSLPRHSSNERRHYKEASRHHHHHHEMYEGDYEYQRKRHHDREPLDEYSHSQYGKHRK